MPALRAASTTSATLSGPPMLPGLIRTAATPPSIALSARLALKWMSAITGIGERRTMRGSASASSSFGTATRTTSHPADASAAICAVVASTSCVFVSVIDCTTTGAPPPIVTPPTEICRSLAIRAQFSPRAAQRTLRWRSVAELARVVVQRDHEDEQHERHADERRALVDLPRHGPPADALDDREEDVPAVERQQRQEVEDRERHADQPEELEVPLEADLQVLRGRSDDPDRPGDLRALARVHEPAERAHRPRHDPPAVADREVRARHDRVGDELRRRDESPDPPALLLDRPARPERDPPAAADRRDGDRPAVTRPDQLGHPCERRRRAAVHRDDTVARLQSRGRRGSVRLDLRDLGARRLRRRTGGVDREEDEERDEHVHARPGGDHGDALPRRLAPVRVAARALVDVAHGPFGGTPGGGSELRL